jgi:hypothetical protein
MEGTLIAPPALQLLLTSVKFYPTEGGLSSLFHDRQIFSANHRPLDILEPMKGESTRAVRFKKAVAEQQPEDRLAELEADRSAPGTRLVEELDGQGKREE